MKKRNIVIIVSIVILLILVILGVSYSYFTGVINGKGKDNVISIGSLNIEYKDEVNILVSVGSPIKDESALIKGYKNTFNINSLHNAKLSSCYSISLVIDEIQEKFKSKFLKWEILKDNKVVKVGDFSNINNNEIHIINSSLTKGNNVKYTLVIWLSLSDTEDQSDLLIGNTGISLKAHIKAESSSIKDTNLCSK